jgi:hypothetical protein
MKLNSCKIDLKFKLKSKNRKIEKEKELNKKKIEQEAYLSAARLVGPISQPTQGDHRLPPPDRGSSSVALSGGSTAPRSAPPPSAAYKVLPATAGNPRSPSLSLTLASLVASRNPSSSQDLPPTSETT